MFLMFQRESHCPSNVECYKLGDPCISCTFNETCEYGNVTRGTCTARVDCIVSIVLVSIVFHCINKHCTNFLIHLYTKKITKH